MASTYIDQKNLGQYYSTDPWGGMPSAPDWWQGAGYYDVVGGGGGWSENSQPASYTYQGTIDPNAPRVAATPPAAGEKFIGSVAQVPQWTLSEGYGPITYNDWSPYQQQLYNSAGGNAQLLNYYGFRQTPGNPDWFKGAGYYTGDEGNYQFVRATPITEQGQLQGYTNYGAPNAQTATQGVFQKSGTTAGASIPGTVIPKVDFGNVWMQSSVAGGHGLDLPTNWGVPQEVLQYLNQKYAPQLNEQIFNTMSTGGDNPYNLKEAGVAGQPDVKWASNPTSVTQMFQSIPGAMDDPVVQGYLKALEPTYQSAQGHGQAYSDSEDSRARNGMMAALAVMTLGAGLGLAGVGQAVGAGAGAAGAGGATAGSIAGAAGIPELGLIATPELANAAIAAGIPASTLAGGAGALTLADIAAGGAANITSAVGTPELGLIATPETAAGAVAQGIPAEMLAGGPGALTLADVGGAAAGTGSGAIDPNAYTMYGTGDVTGAAGTNLDWAASAGLPGGSTLSNIGTEALKKVVSTALSKLLGGGTPTPEEQNALSGLNLNSLLSLLGGGGGGNTGGQIQLGGPQSAPMPATKSQSPLDFGVVSQGISNALGGNPYGNAPSYGQQNANLLGNYLQAASQPHKWV